MFGNEQNKNLARRFVGSITASGATRHLEALELALRLGPDVIFFLSDGEIPPESNAQIRQMNARGKRVTINAILSGEKAKEGADKLDEDEAGPVVAVFLSSLIVQ